MLLIYLTIFMLGFCYTCITLSLFDKKRNAFVLMGVIALLMLLFSSLSAKVSFKNIELFLKSPKNLLTVCVIQIVESIVMMLFSLAHIKTHYAENKRWFVTVLGSVPSLLSVAGLLLVQTLLFNSVSAVSYTGLSIVFALILFLLIAGVVLFLRKVIAKWEILMELKIIICFVQILIAMFLPTIMLGGQVTENKFSFDIIPMAASWLGLLVVAFWGFKKNIGGVVK